MSLRFNQEFNMRALSEQKIRLEELIYKGEDIERVIVERQRDEDVKGFTAWVGEVRIFTERYLKNHHPMYQTLHDACFFAKCDIISCQQLIGALRAVADDAEYFGVKRREVVVARLNESVNYNLRDMIEQDCEICQNIDDSDMAEDALRDYYIKVTARYDSIVKGLGNGLYSYISDCHFYDPDVGVKTIKHNLKVIGEKLMTYKLTNFPNSGSRTNSRTQAKMGKEVFIVHGHDEAAKISMARILEKLDFKPIILHEQANEGRTVIEKIEKYTDVAFAVILYTECDLGKDKDKPDEELQYRARQNVVFEHGYLIGKLGRQRVCALVKGRVEKPGDIDGVVYVSMDDRSWAFDLAKEMKAAGLPVDTNKLL